MQIISMSKLLWFFDMSAPGAVDTDVETAFTKGFLTAPKRFAVNFKPRSPKRAEILRTEWKNADSFLSRYD